MMRMRRTHRLCLLAATLLGADLVDAVALFRSAKPLGPGALGAFERPAADLLADRGFRVERVWRGAGDEAVFYERG